MANYTQRHIISVPLNKIRTAKELLGIFYSTRINCMEIPMCKRLYVLEDIDCSELKYVVRERSGVPPVTKFDRDEDSGNVGSDKHQNFFDLFKGSGEKSDTFFNKKTNKLTLAGLLEVLDGVMEMEGRMLVITTNYPERLDAALIRPGRVDFKLKFGRCTSQCLAQMYESFFNDAESNSHLWPNNFDRSDLPNDRWTPAETVQILLNHMHNPQQGLQHLLREHPKSFEDDVHTEGDA